MNATAHTARQIVKDRSLSTRSARRIARRGNGTLAAHVLAVGVTVRKARSVAGSLRKSAAKLGIEGEAGISFRKGAARKCTRYTSTEVARIAAAYRPRKAEYKIVATQLALAA